MTQAECKAAQELLDACKPRDWTGHAHIEGLAESYRQAVAKAKLLEWALANLASQGDMLERAMAANFGMAHYCTTNIDECQICTLRREWRGEGDGVVAKDVATRP